MPVPAGWLPGVALAALVFAAPAAAQDVPPADDPPRSPSRSLAFGVTMHGGSANAGQGVFGLVLGAGLHADARLGRFVAGAWADYGVETFVLWQTKYRFLGAGAGVARTGRVAEQRLLVVGGSHRVHDPEGWGEYDSWSRELPFVGLRLQARSAVRGSAAAATFELAVLRDLEKARADAAETVGGTTVLVTVGVSALAFSR